MATRTHIVMGESLKLDPLGLYKSEESLGLYDVSVVYPSSDKSRRALFSGGGTSLIGASVDSPTVCEGNFTWRPKVDMEIICQHIMIEMEE